MYIILERFSKAVPWRVRERVFDMEAEALAGARILARYDLTRSEYRVASIGEPESWSDPNPPVVTRVCDACGMEAAEDSLFKHHTGCPNDTE